MGSRDIGERNTLKRPLQLKRFLFADETLRPDGRPMVHIFRGEFLSLDCKGSPVPARLV